MKFFEALKLRMRANKYKNKEDKGGIAYLLSSIREGQTVFDIGAHKAGYLYFMLQKVGSSGRILAFEPQSVLFEYLKKIKKLFRWQNVTVERIALSDSIGTVPLYIPDNKKSIGSSPGATLLKHVHRTDFNLVEEVVTDTMDHYCKIHGLSPSFLKVDVEGNELKIFKGGIETLKKCRPRILVEIEARHVGREMVLETFAFLADLGYRGYFLHGLQHIPISNFTFEIYQNTKDMSNYCNNFLFE